VGKHYSMTPSPNHAEIGNLTSYFHFKFLKEKLLNYFLVISSTVGIHRFVLLCLSFKLLAILAVFLTLHQQADHPIIELIQYCCFLTSFIML
jgi:hypothetical protein